MAIRTVRLDDEAEATLRQIREATGLPISEALKQGLRSLKQQVDGASGHVVITPDGTLRARWVLVWLTKLPARGATFVGEISGITVTAAPGG